MRGTRLAGALLALLLVTGGAELAEGTGAVAATAAASGTAQGAAQGVVPGAEAVTGRAARAGVSTTRIAVIERTPRSRVTRSRRVGRPGFFSRMFRGLLFAVLLLIVVPVLLVVVLVSRRRRRRSQGHY